MIVSIVPIILIASKYAQAIEKIIQIHQWENCK